MTNLCGVSSVANWQVTAATGRNAMMGATTSDAAVTGIGAWRPTMSDLYRLATHDEVQQAIRGKGPALRLRGSTRVVPVKPVGYVYRQGGASPAFYACDRDEADYMLIPIMLGAVDA